ncbi:MAG: MFS transporter [Angelakisella sp.]
MKLNNKRTILVGLAFFSICAFWQMYNSVIPKILTYTFHLDETFSGVIMAADNVLALFLLPLFGALSDRCRSPLGRRMPFILAGTGCSVLLMMLLPLLDNSYAASPGSTKLVLFICVLGLLLVSMGTYRSPAVALMPDLTPKPLRSRANAIINLMGAVGGILYLLVTSVLYSSSRVAGLSHVNYLPLFAIVAGLMAVSIGVLFATIREKKLAEENRKLEAEHPEWNLAEVDESGNEALPPAVKRSLGFLLASIALWFIGYNAIETWFTTFADKMWGMALGDATLCLTIATAGAICSYIPVGIVASRMGRRRTILFGVVLLTVCFAAGYFYTLFSSRFHPALYALFTLVGVAWASINVNSLPMVVEMCRGSDIGKFTGYYYTASMAAQTVTPIVAGWLLKHVSYSVLFLYAAVFVALAFFTMLMVRHGDARAEAKVGLEAFDVED